MSNIIAWELIAIIITLLGGFGALSYQIGRRTIEFDNVKAELNEVSNRMAVHEKECHERQKRITEQFAEGSKRFAVLQERLDQVLSVVAEIKEKLDPPKPKPKRRTRT